MEVVKITKKVYKAVGCEEGHFFGTFAHFKELRENLNLSVQKTCFCCGRKFQPEDFISLACFDKGMGPSSAGYGATAFRRESTDMTVRLPTRADTTLSASSTVMRRKRSTMP